MTYGERQAYDRITALWSRAPSPTGRRHVTPVTNAADCSAVWGATALLDVEQARVQQHRPRGSRLPWRPVAWVAGVGLLVWAVLAS